MQKPHSALPNSHPLGYPAQPGGLPTKKPKRGSPLGFLHLLGRDTPRKEDINRLGFSKEEESSCQEEISKRRTFQREDDFPIEAGPQHSLQTGLLEFLSVFLALKCQSLQAKQVGRRQEAPQECCTCACIRRKLGRERSISVQGSDSKGNSNEFAPGKRGQGQVLTLLCPSTSHLSHLNLQHKIVGKQSRNLALFINLLKLSCGPKEGLARAFQPTQRKSKKMNCNHSTKPEPGSTRAWEAPCLLLDSLAEKEWKSHLPS